MAAFLIILSVLSGSVSFLGMFGSNSKGKAFLVWMASWVVLVIGIGMSDESEAPEQVAADPPPAAEAQPAPIPTPPDPSPPEIQQTLGVPRGPILLLLEEVEVSLDWEESPLMGDEDRLMGTQDDPFVIAEFIGRPDDLRKINVSFIPYPEPLKNVTALFVVSAVMRTVFPEWEDSVEWFGDAMASGEEERTISRRGVSVTLNNYVDVLGIMVLTIEA